MTDQQKIQGSGAICDSNDNDHTFGDKAAVSAFCEGVQHHNSKEGSRSHSAIQAQPDPITQQVSSDALHHSMEASSPSQRKRKRTASDDGSDEERNTDTAVESNPQDPVVGHFSLMIPHLLTILQRGYISWLKATSDKAEKFIFGIRSMEDYLEVLKNEKREFLTTQKDHEQKLATLRAEMRAIRKDEKDHITIRNSLLSFTLRRGSDCPEEWRTTLNQCNKFLKLLKARKEKADYNFSNYKERFDQELEGHDTRIREHREQIEAWAPELAQEERKKRAIHIMQKLVEMGESGIATWSSCELDSLEKWIGRLAGRKPIEDGD